jgi:hypothetical protein
MTEKMTARQLVKWQGYMSMPEMEAVQNIAADEIPADAVIVKIGAGAGTETLAILEVTESVVIFSVDILAGEKPETTNEHLRLEEAGYADTGCVVRIWGDSKIAGKRWPIPVDWLHVDGDHSMNGITGDILAWMRHVKPGGIVSFHDYGAQVWPAVKTVVDISMTAHELLEKYSVDTLRVFRVK